MNIYTWNVGKFSVKPMIFIRHFPNSLSLQNVLHVSGYFRMGDVQIQNKFMQGF